jgi:hypothetical protein
MPQCLICLTHFEPRERGSVKKYCSKKCKKKSYHKRHYIFKEKKISDAILPHEMWKNVIGYESYYQVSNLGRIRSHPNGNYFHAKAYPGKILKPMKLDIKKGKRRNYLSVCFPPCGNNQKKRKLRIHRLVLEAFVPNPEGKKEVNHINTKKDDNRLENLEWCTGEENRRHFINYNI